MGISASSGRSIRGHARRSYYSPRRGRPQTQPSEAAPTAARGSRATTGPRRRTRRRSTDQPINSRLVRALVPAPRIPSPRARVHDRDARAVPGTDASAVVRRRLGDPARDGAGARLPRSRARLRRRRRRSGLGDGEARPLRARHRPRTPGTSRFPASARSGSATSSPSSRAPSSDAILFLAHRDNIGSGPGANDNASGTAALIELARGYGRLGTIAGRPRPEHTLIFLSSDGGAFGGLRRRAVRVDVAAPEARPGRRLARCARRHRTATARDRRARAPLAGPGARPNRRRPVRCPARTAAGSTRLARPARRSRDPVRLRRAGAVPRTRDLGDPADDRRRRRRRRHRRHDRRGSIAVSSSGSVAPPSRFSHRSTTASTSRAAPTGTSTSAAGSSAAGQSSSSSSSRSIPFLVGVIDLFARSRRRRLPLAGRLASTPRHASASGSGSGFVIGLGAVAGVFPRGSATSAAAGQPRRHGLAGRRSHRCRCARRLGWWRARRALVRAGRRDAGRGARGIRRLAPRARRRSPSRRRVISPYALLFVIPSLYAWLWLPQIDAAARLAARLSLRRRARRALRSPSSRSEPSSSSVSTRRCTSSR